MRYNMEQVERIQHMEEILDEADKAIHDLSKALGNYANVKDKIKELEAYYESPVWRNDYADDEKGKLPKNLKRGVLSEDAVYNLLADHAVLQEELKLIIIK